MGTCRPHMIQIKASRLGHWNDWIEDEIHSVLLYTSIYLAVPFLYVLYVLCCVYVLCVCVVCMCCVYVLCVCVVCMCCVYVLCVCLTTVQAVVSPQGTV